MPAIYLFETIQPGLFLLGRQIDLPTGNSLVRVQREYREVDVEREHLIGGAVLSNLLLYIKRIDFDLELVRHLLLLFLTCWLLTTLCLYPSIVSVILIELISSSHECYHRTLQGYIEWRIVQLLWLVSLVCIRCHQLKLSRLCSDKFLIRFLLISSKSHCSWIINFLRNYSAIHMKFSIALVHLFYLLKPFIVVVQNRYFELLFWGRRRRLFFALFNLLSKGLVAICSWLHSSALVFN